MKLTIDDLNQIARRKLDAKAQTNAQSLLTALDRFGGRFGLDQPHRLVQFLPQIMHENGEFRFDREVWGPTPAQKRYEGRKDLGNTKPGDGKKFAGHTGIQITGRANTEAFRDWCRKHIDPNAPDFLDHPELMNTDPWEGLGPLWYWSTRNLNKYADQGDVEMITKRINGGLNGYDDRLALLCRASLVFLSFAPNGLKNFQLEAGLDPDGVFGPKTRAAMHARLLAQTSKGDQGVKAAAAPVVDEKPVAVAPEAIDKPVTQTSGFWERLATIAGSIGLGSASWLGDWKVILAITGGIVVVALIGLLLHSRLVTAVKSIKQEINA